MSLTTPGLWLYCRVGDNTSADGSSFSSAAPGSHAAQSAQPTHGTMLAIDLAPNCQFDSAFIVATVRPNNVGYLATGAGYLGLLQLYLRIRATREVSTVEAAMVAAGLDELAAGPGFMSTAFPMASDRRFCAICSLWLCCRCVLEHTLVLSLIFFVFCNYSFSLLHYVLHVDLTCDTAGSIHPVL